MRNTYIVSLLAFLLSMALTSHQITFQSDSDRLIINADWLQDSSALEEYIHQYNKLLDKKQLKMLSLSFTYCPDPTYILKNFFSQDFNIEVMHINLDGCKIKDKGLRQLMGNIQGKDIRQLQLILSSTGITQAAGHIIGQATGKLELKSLRIALMMIKIGDKGLTDLFLNKVSSQLQDLSLDLTSCKLNAQSFRNFSNFLSKVEYNKLKKVQILLRGNRIEANSSMDMAKTLKRFTSIQSLKIDAYFNNLKTRGVKPITMLLKRLPQLKVLFLNFDLNYIETEGGRLIGESIANLTQLEYLEIGVSTKNFGYNGYHHIIDGIMPLTKLRYLSFRCGVNRIGTKAAKDFQKLFEKVNKLEYLELYLIQNSMYDEGLSILSESIGKLEHLQTLNLNFAFNDVRSSGFVDVVRMLSQKKLSKLWLGLSNNPLQDAQIQEAFPHIEKILSSCAKFEFELLYSKVSESLMNSIKDKFDTISQESKCQATIFINSQEEIKRTKQAIQVEDEKERKAKAEKEEL